MRMDRSSASGGGARWHCLQAEVHAEHIAAAHLSRRLGLETYCPRIRYRRPTKRGPVWMCEALFPGYLFARFERGASLRAVAAMPKVRRVVRFGSTYAEVPDETIRQLRDLFSDNQPRSLERVLRPGDAAVVVDGPLANLQVLVTDVLPGRERVRVMFRLLGRTVEADLPETAVCAAGALPAPVVARRRDGMSA
ncbi:MAG: hypothetical protein N2652_05600 [Kiritimatiellae bacterium]|nr:hypothetical protein [Kiritimatiellia bacterium]